MMLYKKSDITICIKMGGGGGGGVAPPVYMLKKTLLQCAVSKGQLSKCTFLLSKRKKYVLPWPMSCLGNETACFRTACFVYPQWH